MNYLCPECGPNRPLLECRDRCADCFGEVVEGPAVDYLLARAEHVPMDERPGGRPMSKRDRLVDLLASDIPEMTGLQRARQAVSFAYGNLALMSEYANATPEELARLRRLCENNAASLFGFTVEELRGS